MRNYSVCAVVPAAGNGTRLGSDVPKIYAQIAEGVTVLDIQYTKLRQLVDEFVLVISPGKVSQSVGKYNTGITFKVQDHPTGMGDAVFEQYNIWSKYDVVLVLWGDAVNVSVASIESVLPTSYEINSAIIPVTEMVDPYTDWHDGKVSQKREGHNTRTKGLTDIGLFSFSTKNAETLWLRYRELCRGSITDEYNLLPLFPLLQQEGWHVRLLPLVMAIHEARGINTPADLEYARKVYAARYL